MSKNKKRGDIPYHAKKPVIKSIDEYINEYLDKKDAFHQRIEDFFKLYFKGLEIQREAASEEISDALQSKCEYEFDCDLWRLVDQDYADDPLCSVGSLKKQGGRFNIGAGLNPYGPFHSLYFADGDQTAYAEKYHYLQTYVRGPLKPNSLSLVPDRGYSNFKFKIHISKYIDLRKSENLLPLCNVLSAIKPTEEATRYGQKVGISPLRTVQTPAELMRTLMDLEYLKLPTVLSIPSNSQWFGYYCLRAGIQGIIYPSVRRTGHYNLSILIDNLKDSDSKITLLGNTPAVSEKRKELNSKNVELFKIPNKVASNLH